MLSRKYCLSVYGLIVKRFFKVASQQPFLPNFTKKPVVGGSTASLIATTMAQRHYPGKSAQVKRPLSVALTQIFGLSVVQLCPVETILEF